MGQPTAGISGAAGSGRRVLGKRSLGVADDAVGPVATGGLGSLAQQRAAAFGVAAGAAQQG